MCDGTYGSDFSGIETYLTEEEVRELQRKANKPGEFRPCPDFYKERAEQAEVQLAGCGVAALGWAKEPPQPGDYGWSASFADVLKLRHRMERAESVCEAVERGNWQEITAAMKEWREGR
jgi:hypothetical protein